MNPDSGQCSASTLPISTHNEDVKSGFALPPLYRTTSAALSRRKPSPKAMSSEKLLTCLPELTMPRARRSSTLSKMNTKGVQRRSRKQTCYMGMCMGMGMGMTCTWTCRHDFGLHRIILSPHHFDLHHFAIASFRHRIISPLHHFPIASFRHLIVSPSHHFDSRDPAVLTLQ